MAAILLTRDTQRTELAAAADAIGVWLDGPATASTNEAAVALGVAQSIVVLGAGLGVPVADEISLKIKEATYRHAEGFGAGEFRHGSTAVLDAQRGVIGIVDPWSADIVGDLLATARLAQSMTIAIGSELPNEVNLGPLLNGPFAPLGWIVAGQMLALSLARRSGIDSDTPRGLSKFLT